MLGYEEAQSHQNKPRMKWQRQWQEENVHKNRMYEGMNSQYVLNKLSQNHAEGKAIGTKVYESTKYY